MNGLFVTATNTDVGKTVITGAIAAACRQRGLKVGVFKPLASGCAVAGGRLVSADASFLLAAAGLPEDARPEVNPVCLEPVLSPAVAARISGVTIDMEELARQIEQNAAAYDAILVEGAGGLAAPLWECYCVADFMVRLGLPGLLVADSCLGTVNHTVLSTAYARQKGIALQAVVLNRWPQGEIGILEQSNADYIEAMTGLPVWGRMQHCDGISVEETRTASLAEAAEKNLAMDEIIRCMMGNGGQA